MEPQEPHKPQESREPQESRVPGEPQEQRVPREPHGTITVARALGLPALRRGLPEVVAGQELLERPVRWVHAGEVPHIAALLKGGELLLTTGLGVGSRPAEQRAFVHAARRAGHRGAGGGAGGPVPHAAGTGRGHGALVRAAAGATPSRGAVRDGHRGDPHRDRPCALRPAAPGRCGAPAGHRGAAARRRGAGDPVPLRRLRGQSGLPGDPRRAPAVRGGARRYAPGGRGRSAAGVGGAAGAARGRAARTAAWAV